MNILVTGGLGTIGQVLVSALRDRGHHVEHCDRSHHHDPLYHRCDVSEYRQLEKIVADSDVEFDVVYHLAAEFGRANGEDFYESLWRTNAVGTKNILRLQRDHGFRLVFFSSSEVYGDWEGVMEEDVMENHEIKQLNDYAISKWAGELQVLNATERYGTETVRVRLFNTYGPGEYYSPYRSVVCKFIYHALQDSPYTVYEGHHRTSTYVTDTVRTLANIVDNFHPGEIYNIGGEEYHSIRELSDLILDHLGKSDEKVTYEKFEPHTTKDKKVDVSRAKRDLDHQCEVPLEVGIPRTIDWMEAVYGDGAGQAEGQFELAQYL